MTDNDPDTSDPRQVANFTVAYLSRVDQKLDAMIDLLLRRDTRFDRIERDISEVKHDIGTIKCVLRGLKIEFSRRLTSLPAP